MIPSLDLRLRTLMRALSEVILPAIDAKNSLAQEQARLVLGHLHVMSQQMGREASLEAREDEDARQLSFALLAAADGGAETRAAQAELALAVNGSRTAMLAAIDALILASGIDGSADFRQQSTRIVLADARASSWRGRAWFKAMGFDATPDALPDIPALLAAPPAH